MKSKLFILIAFAVGLTYASQPMVVDIDCSEDSCNLKDRIKTVAGTFENDYLYLGNELVFSGETQDLVFLGKALTLNGNTRLGLIAFGKKLMFPGTVGNGIIAGGGSVVVEGAITGNNYIACKSLQMTETATVNGNLFLGCAKGALGGVLNGDLYCGAGELAINGTVNGNVKAYGGRIVIGEKGRINGNLTYGTKEKMSERELSHVSGTVTLDEKHAFHKERFMTDKTGKAVGFIVGTVLCLSFVVTGCLLLFVPVFGRLTLRKTDRAFWNTALYGLVPLLMYPAAIVLSLVLVVTIPLGLILLLSGIPLLFFACLIGTTLTGGYIATKFGWNVRKRHWHFLIGVLAGAVLSAIPFLNFLSFVLMCALGWGVYLGMLAGNREVSGALPAIDGKTAA